VPVRDHREVIPLPARLLWDLEEAAHALHISGRTLKRMARGGELPQGCVVHLSRRRLFVRQAIEQWIADGCPPPARRRGGKTMTGSRDGPRRDAEQVRERRCEKTEVVAK
jgi:hypothetical protein